MKQINLIVARYKEDVDWLSKVNSIPNENIFIYDKHEKTSHVTNNSFLLENIGREAHTYIVHIINNYNNLSDINIFCQGNPFDHCRHMLDFLNNELTVLNDTKFKWLSNSLFDSDRFGKPHHHISTDMKEFFEAIGLTLNTEKFKFGPGAQFLVSKELIMKHPLSFYENMLKQFDSNIYKKEYEDDDVKSGRPKQFYHVATMLERTWEIIFTNE